MKRDWRRELLRDGSGATALEVALVLPVFFFFLLGLVNFALILFGFCNISYASHAACRYACSHSSTSYVPLTTTALNTIVAPFIFGYPSNTYTTTVTYSGGGNFVGNTATVGITVSYQISLPFYTVNSFSMSASSSGVIVY